MLRRLFLVVVLLVIPWAQVSGEEVTFHFTAEITMMQAFGFETLQNALLDVSTFSGSYTFDSGLPDQNGTDTLGLYQPTGDLVIDIGPYHIVEPGYNIWVYDGAYERYEVERMMAFYPPEIGPVDYGEYRLWMENHGESEFGSDALPVTPPSLEAFTNDPQDFATFSWYAEYESAAGVIETFQLEADLLTLVPEPAAVVVLMVLVGVVRRR